MLVAPPGEDPVLLDFFVEAPGRGLADGRAARAAALGRRRLRRRGPGLPHRRLGRGPVRHRVGRLDGGRALRPAPAGRRSSRPAAAHARRGRRRSTSSRRTCSRSCARSAPRRPEARAHYMPAGRPPRVGEVHRDPTLADALERLAAEGPAPFYTGDVAAAVCDVGRRARRAAHARRPRRVRDRRARPGPRRATAARRWSRTRRRARAASCSPTRSRCWTARPSPPSVAAIVDAMAAAQAERTPEFLAGLPTRASSSASPRAGSAPRRTSRWSTPTAGRARSRARTARAAARSCPAPASTSTT